MEILMFFVNIQLNKSVSKLFHPGQENERQDI